MLVRLTNNSVFDQSPSWSPDGSKLAFTSDRDGNFEIYSMDADGNNRIRLTNNSAPDTLPCWSPDGSRISFVSNRDGNNEIYSISASGGVATNLTKLPSLSDTSPSWSGYLPRPPKTLLGTSASGVTTGALGSAAAGFFDGQRGDAITSAMAFDTSTAGSRSAARVTSQSAPYNDEGTNLIFSITTSAGLANRYVAIDESGGLSNAVLISICRQS